MARPSKFTTEDILDAAARAVAHHGRDVTLAQIASELGGPTGSLYHRYSSRDVLLVNLWIRSIRRFHQGFLAAAAGDDAAQSAIDCAVHIPVFCREHPHDAVAMTLYRQHELVSHGPQELRDEVSQINDPVIAALKSLAVRRYDTSDEFHQTLMLTACEESPYGLVRRYLASRQPIPEWMDDAVRASSQAILALGDP